MALIIEGEFMKKVLIAYFSQGGTTAKIATKITQGIKNNNYDADLYNIQDGKPPDIKQYAILGVGFPVYAYQPPFIVTDYIKTLPDLNGMPFFIFLLYGADPGTAAFQLELRSFIEPAVKSGMDRL